jgi:hypothetical protein
MRPFQPIQENLVTPGFELYCLGREAVGIVLARAAAGDARVVKARLCRLGETGSPFRIAGARSKCLSENQKPRSKRRKLSLSTQLRRKVYDHQDLGRNNMACAG